MSEAGKQYAAASILSREPLILYVRPRPRPYGLAGLIADRLEGRPCICIVRTMWTVESPHHLLRAAVDYHRHRRQHPNIRAIIAANTDGELRGLRLLGVESILANHNIFVNEQVFRPLPGVEPVYDAIYNASFSAFKRRKLAALIDRCAHIGYVSAPDTTSQSLAILARAKAGLPHHDFLNPTKPKSFIRMAPEEVNRALALAHVGLCLSRAEGAMTSSMEYLLAGLPVVSTRSRGGRDRYFHPDTSIIVKADPRAVRDAVLALKARNIPRDHVRETTLKLIAPDRLAFNRFVEELRAGHAPIGPDPRWSFDYVNDLYEWRRVEDFAKRMGLGEAAQKQDTRDIPPVKK
jgi:glycosyltransferase involved in cell wall biosynthesis